MRLARKPRLAHFGAGNKQGIAFVYLRKNLPALRQKNRSDAPLPIPRTGNLPADFPAGAVRNRTDLNRKV